MQTNGLSQLNRRQTRVILDVYATMFSKILKEISAADMEFGMRDIWRLIWTRYEQRRQSIPLRQSQSSTKNFPRPG